MYIHKNSAAHATAAGIAQEWILCFIKQARFKHYWMPLVWTMLWPGLYHPDTVSWKSLYIALLVGSPYWFLWLGYGGRGTPNLNDDKTRHGNSAHSSPECYHHPMNPPLHKDRTIAHVRWWIPRSPRGSPQGPRGTQQGAQRPPRGEPQVAKGVPNDAPQDTQGTTKSHPPRPRLGAKTTMQRDTPDIFLFVFSCFYVV